MPRSPSPSGSSSEETDSSAEVRGTLGPNVTSSSKTKSRITEHGRAEGEDPSWAFRPPPGSELLNNGEGSSTDFDWDEINNDKDNEIWLIRVPEGLNIKHIEDTVLNLPTSPQSQRTQIGAISRKHTSYDIWCVGNEEDESHGEEIKTLSCLLPRRSKKGMLYNAPKRIARRIIVTAQSTLPTQKKGAPAETYQNPPRPSYPPEMLKHHFMPYGSQAPTERGSMMDVDAEPSSQSTLLATEDKASSSQKKKKRKGEGEGAVSTLATPKKTKKVRT